MSKEIRENLSKAIREYLENYRRGSELYGFWWKLFTASMLTMVIIFVSLAVILIFKFAL